MQTVTLQRHHSSYHGTLGSLFVGADRLAYSLELPNRDNKPTISRIPAGTYLCKWRKSPRFGWTYHVTDVPGRTWILTHAGNFAGDTSKGYRSDTYGCILLGKRIGTLLNQLAVLLSRPAVRAFNKNMAQQDFILEIADA